MPSEPEVPSARDAVNDRLFELPAGARSLVTFSGLGFLATNDVPDTDPAGDLFLANNEGIFELPVGGASFVSVGQSAVLVAGVASDIAGNLFINPGFFRDKTTDITEFPRVLPAGTISAGPASGRQGTAISVVSASPCPAAYTTDVQLLLRDSTGATIASGPAGLTDSSGDWAGTLTVPAATLRGAYFVTAQCQSHGLDLENTNEVPFKVNGIPTNTSLSVSPNPAVTGQTVALVARPTPSSGSATPTGSVTFSVNGSAVATVAVSDGSATLSMTAADLGRSSALNLPRCCHEGSAVRARGPHRSVPSSQPSAPAASVGAIRLMSQSVRSSRAPASRAP